MDSLRAALHCAGYPDSASQEIAAAMQVLDKYGFINMSVLSGSASSGSTLAASVASQSVSNSAFGMPGSSGHYQTFSGPPSGPGTLTAAYGASPPSFGNATLLSPGSSYNFGQPSIFQVCFQHDFAYDHIEKNMEKIIILVFSRVIQQAQLLVVQELYHYLVTAALTQKTSF